MFFFKARLLSGSDVSCPDWSDHAWATRDELSLHRYITNHNMRNKIKQFIVDL